MKDTRCETGLVQSLTRALSLLEILSEDADGFRLKELSHRAGLSPSTTHRLLTTLEQKRFVQFDRDGCLWNVGVNCFSAGSVFLRRQPFVAESESRLHDLAISTNGTASLAVLVDGKLVMLREAHALGEVATEGRPSRPALGSTALGKVLLAGRRVGGDAGHRPGPLREVAGKTIEAHGATSDLSDVRRLGYAFDDEGSRPGRRCIAAPLYDELGQTVAALSVSTNSRHLSDKNLARVIARVQSTAREITLACGGFASSEERAWGGRNVERPALERRGVA